MVYHKASHGLHVPLLRPRPAGPAAPRPVPHCGGAAAVHAASAPRRPRRSWQGSFPEARILRMDQDSTGRQGRPRGDSGPTLPATKYDIMVGTQMVAKGLDFEDVTLVGVLGIDMSLLICAGLPRLMRPHLQRCITQVVGRSGRAKDLPGRAFIQTTEPRQPGAERWPPAQDYDAFYRAGDRASGRLGLYPPFCSLLRRCGFAGGREAEVARRRRPTLVALLVKQAAQADTPTCPCGCWALPRAYTLTRSTAPTATSSSIKCRNDRRCRDLIRRVMEQLCPGAGRRQAIPIWTACPECATAPVWSVETCGKIRCA